MEGVFIKGPEEKLYNSSREIVGFIPHEFNDKIHSVSQGKEHVLVLDEFGDVYPFGTNTYGQCGPRTEEEKRGSKIYLPLGKRPNLKFTLDANTLVQITQISTCDRLCAAIDNSRRLWVWGSLGYINNLKQHVPPTKQKTKSKVLILENTLTTKPVLVEPQGRQILSVGVGRRNIICLGSSGEVYYCKKQPRPNVPKLTRIKELPKMKQLSVGYYHALMIEDDSNHSTADGRVFVMGENGHNQILPPEEKKLFVKTPIPFPNPPWVSGVEQVSCTGRGSFVIEKNGAVWVFGSNSRCRLGLTSDDELRYRDDMEIIPKPLENRKLNCAVPITNTRFGSVFVCETGKMKVFGNNTLALLGTRSTIDFIGPLDLTGVNYRSKQEYNPETSFQREWNMNSFKFRSTILLTKDGKVHKAGFEERKRERDHAPMYDMFTFGALNLPTLITAISTSGQHALMVDVDKKVWACGTNFFGECGQPVEPSHMWKNGYLNDASLTKIDQQLSGKKVASVACGNGFSLILDNEGKVWTLGCKRITSKKNTTRLISNSYEPQLLEHLSEIRSIAAGSFCASAVNEFGQLFSITTHTDNDGWKVLNFEKMSQYPFEENLEDYPLFSSVSCGSNTIYAVDFDGRVWMVGANVEEMYFDDVDPAYFDKLTLLDTKKCGKIINSFNCSHSLILENENRRYFVMGDNQHGQLGIVENYKELDTRDAKVIETHYGWVDLQENKLLRDSRILHCTVSGTVIEGKDGSLYAFGNNCCGSIGVGYDKNHLKRVGAPTRVLFYDQVVQETYDIDDNDDVDDYKPEYLTQPQEHIDDDSYVPYPPQEMIYNLPSSDDENETENRPGSDESQVDSTASNSSDRKNEDYIDLDDIPDSPTPLVKPTKTGPKTKTDTPVNNNQTNDLEVIPWNTRKRRLAGGDMTPPKVQKTKCKFCQDPRPMRCRKCKLVFHHNSVCENRIEHLKRCVQ
jgi:alpha-tubulin suppressor-like RCC1 family protein